MSPYHKVIWVPVVHSLASRAFFGQSCILWPVGCCPYQIIIVFFGIFFSNSFFFLLFGGKKWLVPNTHTRPTQTIFKDLYTCKKMLLVMCSCIMTNFFFTFINQPLLIQNQKSVEQEEPIYFFSSPVLEN